MQILLTWKDDKIPIHKKCEKASDLLALVHTDVYEIV